MKQVISSIICFIVTLSAYAEAPTFTGWTHLELGAGNYGAEGHTRCALEKTFGSLMVEFTNKESFIDIVPKKGTGDYDPAEQYQVLFWTLDQLVERLGPSGVFHVNDLIAEYAEFAAKKLQIYAMEKGYDEIKIDVVPGDYRLIDPHEYLKRYGLEKYASVHLKNPEVSFYHHCVDGDVMVTSDITRKIARDRLQNLANLSSTGLYLFIIDHINFIPASEHEEFIDQGIFYHPSQDWEQIPYVFPEGMVIPESYCKIFFIESNLESREKERNHA